MIDTVDTHQFDDEALVRLTEWFSDVVSGVLNEDDKLISIRSEQDRKKIKFDVTFADERMVGLFMGPRKRLVKTLLTMLRFQQILPHNRYIEINVHKEDGSVDRVYDSLVFRRGEDGEREDLRCPYGCRVS